MNSNIKRSNFYHQFATIMKKISILIASFLFLGFSLMASNDPVVKETVNGKTVELEVLSEGNLSLFSHDTEIIPGTVPQDPSESFTTTYTSYYISKGSDDLVELKCSNYKKVLKAQMKDKPELVAKVGTKGYRFAQLEEIISDYNK